MKRRYIFAALTFGGVFAGPASGVEHSLGFRSVHEGESALLSQHVDPEQLRKLLIWDDGRKEWRPSRTGETPTDATQVLVLHLWADYCAPCREEFPIWKEVVATAASTYGERVRVMFLSETESSNAMDAFLTKYQARMPSVPHYQSAQLTATLRASVPFSLPLPMTLVLDEKRAVRAAFVGPIARRRGEISSVLSRLSAR